MKALIRPTSASLCCLATLAVFAVGSVSSDTQDPIVVRPERKTFVQELELAATVQAYETVPIFSYIPGFVERIGERTDGPAARQLDMGDAVKQGEVLALLHVPEREAEVRVKEATVVLKQAELIRLEQRLELARRKVETTEAKIKEETAVSQRVQVKVQRWQTELARIKALFDDNVVDNKVLDETLMQFRTAESEKHEIDARILKAQALSAESLAEKAGVVADVDVAKSRILVALAELKQSQIMLDYREIRAPFDGLIVTRGVHRGRLVRGIEEKEPMFVVARTDKMRVLFDVPLASIERIKVGDPARVRSQIPGLENRLFEGPISHMSPNVDPDSSKVRAEIVLPNSEAKLRAGMSVKVSLKIEHKNVWLLPKSALIEFGTVLKADDVTRAEVGKGVYRVEDNKVILTPVEVGLAVGAFVQVLKYQPAPNVWSEFTGTEQIILNAAGWLQQMPLGKKP